VVGIQRDWDDKKKTRLEIEPLSQKRKGSKGEAVPSSSRSEIVSREVGNQFKLGDTITVSKTLDARKGARRPKRK
jgi:hypothetical protein